MANDWKLADRIGIDWMKFNLKSGDTVINADVQKKDGKLTVVIGTANHQYELVSSASPRCLFRLENQVLTGFAVREKDEYYIHLNGRAFHLSGIADDAITTDASHSGDLKVVAPMPGTVIKVLVQKGDSVVRRQPLVIVEAMKMENEVRALADSIVDQVLVVAGEKVGFGQELVKLSKPRDESGETPAL